MLRPTLTIAVPVFGLALILSQTAPDQRAAWAASFRDRLGFAPNEPQRLGPQQNSHPVSVRLDPPPSLGPDTFAVDADRSGQYQATMLVRGREIPVLIDTGASYVTLTYDDAASIGMHPANADFRYAMRTANGIAHAAGVVVPEIRVGNVEARNVPALISSPGALTGGSLLGMSFLKKLSGFEIEGGRLVLRQ